MAAECKDAQNARVPNAVPPETTIKKPQIERAKNGTLTTRAAFARFGLCAIALGLARQPAKFDECKRYRYQSLSDTGAI